MSNRMIGLIWAQANDGVIGVDNTIPWRLPEDMANFRETTTGHPVIMGRRTWDSLPAAFRPLAGRRNIVVTRQSDWAAEGAERAASLPDALAMTGTADTWIAGGGEIYRQALPLATTLLVTEVDTTVAGDAFAPVIGAEWHAPDTPWRTAENGLRYRIRHYVRQ
ncbi:MULTISPECIES: dihydrofolate reductase [Nocardia]|nr:MULTISPECIES: dihydrofolate reductase [Nocardia]